MKRFATVYTLTLLASTAALHAQTGGATCTNASLKGTYGVSITGTRPAPAVLPSFPLFFAGSLEQVLGIVIQTFDGNGNFTQVDNVKGSLSGITPDRAGSGTYSVNADCTGTFTVLIAGNPPIVNRFVLTDGGNEFRSVVTSPQAVMITASGRKL